MVSINICSVEYLIFIQSTFLSQWRTLVIRNVKMEDSGQYMCQVRFFNKYLKRIFKRIDQFLFSLMMLGEHWSNENAGQ